MAMLDNRPKSFLSRYPATLVGPFQRSDLFDKAHIKARQLGKQQLAVSECTAVYGMPIMNKRRDPSDEQKGWRIGLNSDRLESKS